MLLIAFLSVLPAIFSVIDARCLDGWHQSSVQSNKCYLIVVNRKIWFEAQTYCKNIVIDSYLTSITSAFENANINAAVVDTPSISSCSQMWIGANDIEESGTFVWSDGLPFTYSNWGAARVDGKWKTEPCGTENCFICKSFVSNTTVTTTTSSTTSSSTLILTTLTTAQQSVTNTTKEGSTSLTAQTNPTTANAQTTTVSHGQQQKTDCYDWHKDGGGSIDGIYQISPPGINPFDVWCDMTTDGGGWTVFQSRMNGDLSFFDKIWNEYKIGFNNGLDKSFWLGNDKIHILSTKDSNVELRIDLWGDRAPATVNPNIYLYGKYTSFYIENEANYYTFHISPSSVGNASSLAPPGFGINYSNGAKFSTIDRDSSVYHCSSPQYFDGGWWTVGAYCSFGALNGKYIPPSWQTADSGMAWRWYNPNVVDINPSRTRMMLRKLVS